MVEVEAVVVGQVVGVVLLHHQEAPIVVLAVVQEAFPVAPQVQAEPTLQCGSLTTVPLTITIATPTTV